MDEPLCRAVVLLVLARSPSGMPEPPKDFRLVLIPFFKMLFPHCRRARARATASGVSAYRQTLDKHIPWMRSAWAARSSGVCNRRICR